MEVWNVDDWIRFPTGKKFAFVLIARDGPNRGRVYGVDNHHGLAVHEHFQGDRKPIAAKDWQEARFHFQRRVDELLRASKDPSH